MGSRRRHRTLRCRCLASEPDEDLAHVLRLGEIVEGLGRLIEPERLAVQGLDAVLLDRPQQVHEHRPAAVGDPANGHVLADQRHVIGNRRRRAGGNADHHDGRVRGRRLDRLPQGVLPAGLDDDVRATAGQLHHRLGPVGVGAVVDGDVGAQAACELELVVAGRGHGDTGPVQLGQLECGHRDAAGSQTQHQVAGLDPGHFHQRVPGGHRGRCQRSDIFVLQRRRHLDQGTGRQRHLFGQPAVVGHAQVVGEHLGIEPAIQPGGKVPTDDTVARRDLADACADGGHDAHALGNRNARGRKLAAVGALQDLQVAVDQAHQSRSHDDLTRSCDRLRHLDRDQALKAGLIANLECFQGGLPVLRRRPNVAGVMGDGATAAIGAIAQRSDGFKV
ncbi:hypothetical protein XAP7430_540025 [Xanthomonas phaseoli pv. phaseoli]|uniref:Uncharacterized protein n=1 Tax=Xanthomonas campestris pv. phaseoli TaxID=317013 RepID=A0AB38E2L2_XANCH|nr:hypothetical protein XAP7430_540025 [Xanthomonas phaseoli pv. phaseoli]